MEKTNRQNKKIQKSKFCFLHLTSYFLLKKGQSILEYTILLGVIVLVMFAMGPMLKRGTQSLIKIVADQVGVQQNAEQKFDETGHMEASYTATRGSTDKRTQDVAGAITYSFDDVSVTTSNTLINLGYTEER
ncbi:MAG TPA: hypothetical protein DE315_02890 [Candidatus Omnitrophica bacterium]|nr:MAG: hypothetical protein A2Y05_00160 [Omnitrophica WOR_2 bacterium GWA2_53_43]HBO98056.1 hypothetical protein [Candidatus Omnitrophota bacterium]HCI44467.1 hypothetical protein [Candidatus Omnitrophota bacterium]